MPSQTVHVLARFAVRADQVEAFIAAARETLVAPTQSEPGCLQYELWQDATDPTRFSMVETWESAEALEQHLALPSLQAAVGKLAPMAAEPPTVQRMRNAAA